MSIIEEQLHLIIIDNKRIITLEPLGEVYGDMLRILLKYFKDKHKEQPWLLEPTPLPEAPKDPLDPPVLVPATENQVHHMPKGITKQYHRKDYRSQFAIPPVNGTGVLVLRAIAELDRPVKFGEINAVLPEVPVGTLGPQLLKLYEAGYLNREKDASARYGTVYFYSLTPLALDLLTRPNTTEVSHDNGTIHDSRTTSDETRDNN
jgi:DNA-binding HxlR family transcriptional regulator